jgi:hypothetical protein
MNPDEVTGELETAIATDDDQITAETEAQEASEEEQADAPDDETEDLGEGSEPVYSVLIDGEERQLSKSEIEKSMMLHKAFTQKTQGLSEEKRQWESAVAKARETLGREVENVKGWLEFYQANQPQEPDWATLAETSPADYVRQKAKWDAEAGKRSQAQQMYQQIKQQEEATAQERFVSELYAAFPSWQDQPTMMQEVGEIYVAAKYYGFSQDDVNGMLDTRAFKALKDAAEWRKLQAKKTEVQARVTAVPQKPPVRTNAAPRPGKDMLKELASKPTIANAMKLNF